MVKIFIPLHLLAIAIAITVANGEETINSDLVIEERDGEKIFTLSSLNLRVKFKKPDLQQELDLFIKHHDSVIGKVDNILSVIVYESPILNPLFRDITSAEKTDTREAYFKLRDAVINELDNMLKPLMRLEHVLVQFYEINGAVKSKKSEESSPFHETVQEFVVRRHDRKC